MFKGARQGLDIRPGSVFERVHDAYNSIEVAKVVLLADDFFGIPHVRFQVSYRYSDREEGQGVRVLAVKAFAERFRPTSAAT